MTEAELKVTGGLNDYFAGQALAGLLASGYGKSTNKAGEQIYDAAARRRVVKLARQMGELLAAPSDDSKTADKPDEQQEATAAE